MEFLVRLNSIEDAIELAQKLEQYDCRADIRVEDKIIDAKSFMGLIALGLGKQLRVMIRGKADNKMNGNLIL